MGAFGAICGRYVGSGVCLGTPWSSRIGTHGVATCELMPKFLVTGAIVIGATLIGALGVWPGRAMTVAGAGSCTGWDVVWPLLGGAKGAWWVGTGVG